MATAQTRANVCFGSAPDMPAWHQKRTFEFANPTSEGKWGFSWACALGRVAGETDSAQIRLPRPTAPVCVLGGDRAGACSAAHGKECEVTAKAGGALIFHRAKAGPPAIASGLFPLPIGCVKLRLPGGSVPSLSACGGVGNADIFVISSFNLLGTALGKARAVSYRDGSGGQHGEAIYLNSQQNIVIGLLFANSDCRDRCHHLGD